MIPVFLIPSFVFWTGGMYKDGFVFLFMMVVVWQFFQLLNKNDRKGTRILYLAVAFAGIFLLRNYIALLLLPSLLCWGLNMRWPRHAAWTFVIIYLIGSMAILFGSQLHAGLDFPSFIAERQQAFLALPANTKLPVPAIEPTAVGMIRYLPIAMRIGFAEPVLWDLPGLRYLVFSIELLFLLFLAALALYKRPQLTVNQHSYLFFALFFTASVWLCLGYMAPITGAIVRYRVICLPILASALMCTALIRQNK
ncbi:MAG: hypothetical protein H7Y27_04430 [Gemmatimonadaceae bacterium]|nr:hypothetical protein [Chitinophagaceae bacterium]